MTTSATRAHVLDRLAGLIQRESRDRALRVGIDGIDAAGKTTLADELAAVLEKGGVGVLRASIDGFHQPASIRHRRAVEQPAVSYYEDSFDYGSLRNLLLDPFGTPGTRAVRTRAFDSRTDAQVEEEYVDVSGCRTLLFDGVFLLRPELASCWDLSVFVAVEPRVSLERALTRDLSLFGNSEAVTTRYRERYLPGQDLYLSMVQPDCHADVLLDNNDPNAPELLRFPS